MKTRYKQLGLAAVAAGALAIAAQGASAQVVSFDAIPDPLPPNMPSLGFEATRTTAFGDRITLAPGTFRTPQGIAIAMSSWACESGAWNFGDCSSTANSSFSHPITITLYDETGTTQLATRTQEFSVPYRPSADPGCTGVDAGKWKAADGACYNGFAFTIAFDLRSLDLPLPDTFTYAVSYNTRTYGSAPVGIPGGYDSLNVGVYLAPAVPTVGTDPEPGVVFLNGAFDNWGQGYGVMAEVRTGTAGECKDGQWMNLQRPDGSPFKNQGDCVSFVQTSR